MDVPIKYEQDSVDSLRVGFGLDWRANLRVESGLDLVVDLSVGSGLD